MIRLIYRWLKRPLILIIVIVIVVLLLRQCNPFKNIFQSKPLVIDNTPLVIKDIKAIAELNTATLYQEVVVDSTARSKFPFVAKREIVLVVKGKVIAGVDLQQLRDEDVIITGDSITVHIPASEIRDVIMNPSDIETFYESGRWDNEEITKLKVSARARLIQSAADNKLTVKADEKTHLLLQQFLTAAGFNKIVILRKD